MDDKQEKANRVMAFLRRNKTDRGAMANLRCALTKTRKQRAWPLLGEIDGIGDPTIETIVGLFATHPEETTTGNLGALCKKLSGENNTFEGRFKRLLSCSTREEVSRQLRPLVTAAKAKGFPVNYRQLLLDLSYWSDDVRVHWAQAFWGGDKE